MCTEDKYSEMAETCYSKCSVKVTKSEEDRTKIEVDNCVIHLYSLLHIVYSWLALSNDLGT